VDHLQALCSGDLSESVAPRPGTDRSHPTVRLSVNTTEPLAASYEVYGASLRLPPSDSTQKVKPRIHVCIRRAVAGVSDSKQALVSQGTPKGR
jgi:hypothetical protein